VELLPLHRTDQEAFVVHANAVLTPRGDLVRLRREKRVLEMEVEILKRASAYFARENILPK
jgi:hypothetical protein